jgi:hypothetical protein
MIWAAFIHRGPPDEEVAADHRSVPRRTFPRTRRVGPVAGGCGPRPGALLDAAVERAVPGTLMLTPLALALILVETTDLIFAADPIPAIFAITADPLLVFTSNVFAILALRSLVVLAFGVMASLWTGPAIGPDDSAAGSQGLPQHNA